MTIKQGLEAEYQQFLEVNSKDGYSFAAVQYMARWADFYGGGDGIRRCPCRTLRIVPAAKPIRKESQVFSMVVLSVRWPISGCMVKNCASGTTSSILYDDPGTVNPASFTIMM